MRLSGILKPEYFYQPKVAWQRLLPFRAVSTAEFVNQKLPWGMHIRVRPQEEHGRILATLGVVDLAVTETLWRLTEPGEIVVDVGANIGCMTAVLAARVSSISGSCIWAFEAHPEIFTELKYNVDQWQEQLTNTQFIIQNLAISDQSGTVKLLIPKSFSSNRGLASIIANDENLNSNSLINSENIIVNSCTLDNIFPTQLIGVMKIDVEGHELKVIKGAINLLKQGRIRDCIFEEHLDYPTPVTTLFETMGYKIFRIERNIISPILLAPDSNDARTHWQPTSFIATRNPESVMSKFQKPGWQVLQ
ncbi:FkbM family methyltransferase [Halotia branconii]|uniref:FkbM family methyltransferase n=1 Tax=Halotia branconii CENA392 TaxID=1539056 RepID=A0AAJ6NYU4_9CYAN|nr:FkbM family methyltransferase [Halotia branconii]WGV29001.1 FkbM family methyltransferase [Halotia branconii CENA392]